MYVNKGPISDHNASYLISYVIDHIERIRYTGYYDCKSGTFKIYPRQVVCPGSYPPELFKARRLAAGEVERGY